ncbi:MAG: hypothetical protein H0X66_05465 [Verrucomicrobia bacterium]|nr:hypothetical protein [Verrucomicrobiota bacterium]
MAKKFVLRGGRKGFRALGWETGAGCSGTCAIGGLRGSALVALGFRTRTTKDVDIVALMESGGELTSPDPLPEFLTKAAAQVARDLGLFDDWLNNGPSQGEGGLFQMGLPVGFPERLVARSYGPRLTVYFIGSLDQIYFKLYAAVDQGGDPTHVADLQSLTPTETELEAAARWTMTHDTSDGFKSVMQELLKEMGYGSVAKNI